ncbi:MAG: ABC transporter permease [Propionibacteriaceae bacterium]|nr:ABC transporter permease [Propionibacteriaceae bacterium]
MTQFPRWAWVPFGLGVVLLLSPLLGMLTRVAWRRLPELLASKPAQDALRLSLVTCSLSTLVVIVIGVPVAVVLARSRGWWTSMVRTLVTVPMVLPPVVAGLALLVTFGRRGLVGAQLAVLGVEIGFTTVAVIVAQAFVSLPFLVTSLEGALRAGGGRYERIAANLGASPNRVFWQITLPVMAPALASGVALSFARSLGEFGATLTFAGSLQGITRTLPLEIYLLRESDSDVALALSLVLIVIALLIVLLATRLRTWGTHD